MNIANHIFKNIKAFSTIPQLIQVFSAIVFSKYNYGIELYGNCRQVLMTKLQVTQNRILKTILSKRKRTSTNAIHKATKILKIKDSFFMRQCLLIHDLTHNIGKIPDSMKDKIQRQADIHNRNTRGVDNITVSASHYKRRNKIIEAASLKWNSLTHSIKSTTCRDSFKNLIRNNFLDKY
jgi:hypothetical protein